MKNVKLFIIIPAFLLLSAGAFAQAQVAVGVKGGLNFAKLDGTSADGTFKTAQAITSVPSVLSSSARSVSNPRSCSHSRAPRSKQTPAISTPTSATSTSRC